MENDLKRQYVRDCEASECDSRGYTFEITRRELGLLGAGLVCSVRRLSAAPVEVSRLHIGPDGEVTLFTGKVELGQGSRTVLTAVVAEELHMPAGRVRVVMGDTDLVPDDGGTWGSLTVPQTVPVVRTAAASLRKYLDASEGETDHLPITPKPVNGLAIVTGAKKYPSDLAFPGMLHGKVIRGPAYRSKIVSAPKGEGIVHDGDFLGIVASTASEAHEHARRVQVNWKPEPLPTAAYKEKSIPPKPGEGGRYPTLITNGTLSRGFTESVRRHESSYSLPCIAHVPMEPRAAVAEWKDGRVTVWSGTQAPFLVRKEIATAFRILESQVRVISVDCGGAFGGKQRGEVDVEAARLAKDAGAPVKLAWTREEEFTASYCRPPGVVEVASGLDRDGLIHAWQHRNYNSGSAGLKPPYSIPHYSCEHHRSEAPLRQGSYRSLAAVANTLARESHVNELAALTGTDPVEFRLRNIEDIRLRTAIQRTADRFGWAQRGNSAVGVACTIEKDARLVLFVEMDISRNQQIRVRRMTFCLDAGRVLDPDGLRNQAQGALIMGIGGALFEELRYDATRITNARLSQYRVPRFFDVPEIDILLTSHPQIPPAGAGEAPITLVAPAIAAALTGRVKGDLRTLPLGNKA